MKRRALKLLLFLLTGAIINLAVAWGIWAYHDSNQVWPSAVSTSPSMPPEMAHDIWTRFATEAWPNFGHAVWTKYSAFAFTGYHGAASKYEVGFILPPDISGAQMRSSTDRVGTFEVARSECGMPMRCLSIALGGARVDATRFVPIRHNGFDMEQIRLPKRPIMPRFAINTIFYAALLFALFAVPGAVRRRLRHKRGQCASCGYSLRDITSEKCPECGVAA